LTALHIPGQFSLSKGTEKWSRWLLPPDVFWNDWRIGACKLTSKYLRILHIPEGADQVQSVVKELSAK